MYVAIGYAKYGFKTSLYFYKPPKGQMIQMDRVLCFLDFYVLESEQRNGIGKALFDKFLEVEYLLNS
jgi:GNAT superfamily N-acetyltransferase